MRRVCAGYAPGARVCAGYAPGARVCAGCPGMRRVPGYAPGMRRVPGYAPDMPGYALGMRRVPGYAPGMRRVCAGCPGSGYAPGARVCAKYALGAPPPPVFIFTPCKGLPRQCLSLLRIKGEKPVCFKLGFFQNPLRPIKEKPVRFKLGFRTRSYGHPFRGKGRWESADGQNSCVRASRVLAKSTLL